MNYPAAELRRIKKTKTLLTRKYL